MLLANELNSLLATMKPTDSLQIANEKVRKRLHELARDYYRTTLEELNEQLELHDYDLESYIPENKEYLAKLKKEFQGTIIKPHRLKMAGTMLEKSYPEAANSLECKEAFMKMLLRGEIEANRIYLAKLEADFANLKVQDDLFAGIDVDVIRPIPDLVGGRLVYPAAQESAASPTLETLEQAIAHYVAYKASLNTDAKTGKDIEHALKLIRFVMPDVTHVGDLTKAKINEFEAKIAHIPTNFTKIEDLKKLDYAQLVQVSKTYPRISASTYDKYRVTVRAFLKWCIDTERLPNMVLPKWVGKDKQLAKDKRFPFTEVELKAFFNSPQYSGHAPDTDAQKHRHLGGSNLIQDAYYWLPLVGLYTGMRMSEIIQMTFPDLRQEGEIHYFDINIDLNGLEEKTLKNEYSKRKVPLHPMLIKMGFLDYVAAQRKKNKSRIFEQIKRGPDGKFSHNYSKYFSRYLTNIEIKHPKLTFHSLRHTFIDTTEKRTPIKHSAIKALVGHSEQGVTGDTYGSAYTVPELYEALCQLSYPLESHNKLLATK